MRGPGVPRAPRIGTPRRTEAPAALDRPLSADDQAAHERHLRERHNSQVLRYDAAAVGVIGAATPFLPVLVARLGGSAVDVGLISVVTALGALVMGVPAGALLERRRDLVRWYSLSRLVSWLGYGAIAAIVVLAPGDRVVVAVLVAWAIAAVPATVGQVAFPIVMNDAAGPGGRFELLGRRWATMSLATAGAVAATGWLLDRLPLHEGYGLAFAAFAVAGVVAYAFERQIRLVREAPAGRSRASWWRGAGVGRWRGRLDANRQFLRYLLAHGVIAGALQLVAPVITLFYVRGVRASDAEIGLIATASALATFGGYHAWRRLAARSGGRRVVVWSTLGVAAYPGILGLTPSPLTAGIVVAAGAAAYAGLSLALFDELMRRVNPDRALVMASIDYAVSNAVGIFAPLAGAALADALGLSAALAVGSVVALAGAALLIIDRPAAPARPA